MKVRGYYCVGCETCYGCGRKNEISLICDKCEGDAKYHYNGIDLCEDCLNEMLNDTWNELSVEEKAEKLEIDGLINLEEYADYEEEREEAAKGGDW